MISEETAALADALQEQFDIDRDRAVSVALRMIEALRRTGFTLVGGGE